MENKTKSTIDIYIDYVTQQIEKLKRYEDLEQDSSISFHDVNTALAHNLKVTNALNMEYQRLKSQYSRIKREFDCWYSEKYIYERNLHNINDLASSKWLSAKELDCLVIVNNAEEYNNRKERLEAMELRVAFIRRLLDSWKSFSYTLNTLSENIRNEYYAELNESKYNNQPQSKPIRRAVVKE